MWNLFPLHLQVKNANIQTQLIIQYKHSLLQSIHITEVQIQSSRIRAKAWSFPCSSLQQNLYLSRGHRRGRQYYCMTTAVFSFFFNKRAETQQTVWATQSHMHPGLTDDISALILSTETQTISRRLKTYNNRLVRRQLFYVQDNYVLFNLQHRK